jgi:hypothetical protein
LKKITTQTFGLFSEVYRENTLSGVHVFEWNKRFSEERGDVENDEQPGHLVMVELMKMSNW